jgi:ABC-2 type transport system permease protein
MLRSVFTKSLWERRRNLAWWSVGVAALVAITVAFYPSVRDSAADFEQMLEQLPEGLRALFVGNVADITSPVGYLNSQLFASNGPILLLVFAIGAGSRAIAGEEERGTLDLLLSLPISRRSVLVQKFASTAVELAVLCGILWLSTAASGPPLELDVPPSDLAAAVGMMYLFALGMGTITLAVGCGTGRRGVAIGVGSAVAVASFLLSSLAPLADATEPLQKASPFYYASGATPLANGFDPVHGALLVAIVVVALAAATWAFGRRDLRT